jgi:hypothetical protein
MTNKNHKETKRLDKIKGTITATFVTGDILHTLNDCYNNDSLSEYKAHVIEAINMANSTPYTKKMISKINTMTSKDNIVSYIYNAVLSGSGLCVI